MQRFSKNKFSNSSVYLIIWISETESPDQITGHKIRVLGIVGPVLQKRFWILNSGIFCCNFNRLLDFRTFDTCAKTCDIKHMAASRANHEWKFWWSTVKSRHSGASVAVINDSQGVLQQSSGRTTKSRPLRGCTPAISPGDVIRIGGISGSKGTFTTKL